MTTGIDAVVLGLAGKAIQVFALEGCHLSFPLAPIGIRASRLRALVDDPMSPDGQSCHAEFSQLVNEVPTRALWQPDGDRLWDIYGDVLAGAVLAQGSLTAAEESDYQRAYAALYTPNRGGVLGESLAVRAYEQCRDAYLAAAQEYNNRKGDADTTNDPHVTEQWTTDEAALRERIAEAERDWTTTGHRCAVEDARRLLRELGSRSPTTIWAGYRKLFDPELPEIFFHTAPDGSGYLPTGYLPSDVVDTAWPVITVTHPQLAGLTAAAPPQLRDRLSDVDGPAPIESVSFEYSAVKVTRSWLVPEAFGSRAWRFRDPTRVLSDGAPSPTGECTAYVDGLVLARTITVRHRADAPPDLGFLPSGRPSHTVLKARPYPKEAMLARVAARREARNSVAAGPVTAIRHPLRTAPTRIPSRRAPVLRPRRPATPAPTVVTSDPDEVYVIAFQCRALPRSPDPDPTLTW
ncbi:MAG: hypothetical protein ABR608_12390 [Pseudonocardiaceae bacterium]